MILSLDLGTTGNRAILFDTHGRVKRKAYQEFAQHFPKEGWVEHDAEEIWRTAFAVAQKALRGVPASKVEAIGITNQRETAVAWDTRTGKPLSRAIVWQDRRTTKRCEQLARKKGMIARKTGLTPDAYFSATKYEWLLKNVPAVDRAHGYGAAKLGTIDSWITWKLTGEHITDASNASRTMLYNLRTGDWDAQLCRLFDVPRDMLPRITDSSGMLATTELFGKPIPLTGIAGDQQAALYGQACHAPGQAKITYGTGCFLLVNTGRRIVRSRHLLTTVAWQADGQRTYALEGAVFMGGATIQWLRDQLGIIRTAAESEKLAASVPDTHGVAFVPAMTGLGAPHWDMRARGLIVGLTRGTTKAHIARAALEGIAFQNAEVVEAMRRHLRLSDVRADGGASANDLLMQFQADLLGIPLKRPRLLEVTALGAAGLAGRAIGHGLPRLPLKTFTPRMDAAERARRLARWHDALGRARHWAQD